MTRQECVDRGWLPENESDHDPAVHGLDFVLVSGDAYVDHPSFCQCGDWSLARGAGTPCSDSSPAGLEEAESSRVLSTENRFDSRRNSILSQSLHGTQG